MEWLWLFFPLFFWSFFKLQISPAPNLQTIPRLLPSFYAFKWNNSYIWRWKLGFQPGTGSEGESWSPLSTSLQISNKNQEKKKKNSDSTGSPHPKIKQIPWLQQIPAIPPEQITASVWVGVITLEERIRLKNWGGGRKKKKRRKNWKSWWRQIVLPSNFPNAAGGEISLDGIGSTRCSLGRRGIAVVKSISKKIIQIIPNYPAEREIPGYFL